MNEPIVPIVAIVTSYLIGGIPVGVLLAGAKGVDIRSAGSRNIGATNVLRVLGLKLGLVVFVLDILKGAAPVLMAIHLHNLADAYAAACAVACVLGHCFSPYLLFAGGKGVSTCCGVCLALSWPAGLIGFALWITLTALSRYVSLASMITTGVTWLLVWIFGGSTPAIIAIAFVGALSIVQHRSNIKRLLAGTESKIGQRAKLPTSDSGATEPDTTEEAADA